MIKNLQLETIMKRFIILNSPLKVVITLVFTLQLISGCGTTSESTSPLLDRSNETSEALNWFNKAQKKREKLDSYINNSVPKSVKEKTVILSAPDSVSNDSINFFIGDIANLAYLVKIGKVYLNDLTKDALSYSIQAYNNSSVPDYHTTYFLKTFTFTLHHYDSLETLGAKYAKSFTEQIKQKKPSKLSIPEELEISGILEKEKSLLETIADIVKLKTNLAAHAREVVSNKPFLIDTKEEISNLEQLSLNHSEDVLNEVKAILLRRASWLEQYEDAFLKDSMISQMITTTKIHLQTIESIQDSK